MVIDPAGDVDQIIELTKTLEARVKYIYLTHCHADHTAGVNELRSLTNAKVLIHRADAQGLEDDKINLATYIGLNEIIIKDVLRVDDKDKIHVGQLEFLVIHTPGHTVGGSSLFCKEEKLLFIFTNFYPYDFISITGTLIISTFFKCFKCFCKVFLLKCNET